jgi:hypothetical protein
LVAILQDAAGRYGDIPVQQQLTGATFLLNKQILGFHPNIDIERLKKVIEEARVPTESVNRFLALLYGSLYRPSNESITQENAATFIHLIVLTKALGADGWEDQMHWLEELFDKYCHRMDSKVLYALLTSEARYAINHEPIADIMVSNLQKRRFHEEHPLSFHKVNFDGHSSEVRELMLSKLGSPKPISFTRTVHSSGAPLLRAIGIGLATLELSPGDWTISIVPAASSSAPSSSAPSTSKELKGSDAEGEVHKVTVHEWLAYLHWPFFRRLLLSGLGEVQQKSIELPSDFPPRLLTNIITCIYRGNVDARMKKMDLPTCDFALCNAAEYGLCDPTTGKITEAFHTLFRSIQSSYYELEHPGMETPTIPVHQDVKIPPIVPPTTQEWFDKWHATNSQIPPTD